MGSFKFRVRKFMKLFKSLLVAPATLGLLAPMSATANEVTINDFNPAEELAITNSRVDGLEARLNNFEAVTFSYDFALDLSTSFTGEDSFDVALIGGNADSTTVDSYMGGDRTSDALVLDGVSYPFPLGSAMVIVGDGVGPDD